MSENLPIIWSLTPVFVGRKSPLRRRPSPKQDPLAHPYLIATPGHVIRPPVRSVANRLTVVVSEEDRFGRDDCRKEGRGIARDSVVRSLLAHV